MLVARKALFRNRVPTVPGGGTVAYVNPTEHVYLADIERREEGGTPAIVESIRAGLVFGLKEAVGVEAIREREESFIRRAIDRWSATRTIEILGNPRSERLSIVSFVVRHRRAGRTACYLHHNYVVALLNDLFGIQARGGCSCAGPYGHRLLGIDLEHSRAFEHEIARGCEGIKPGWVRVNFNYFISEAVFAYILDAVDLVASDGWRLLPAYRFDPASGLWSHRGGVVEPPLSLGAIRYDEGVMRYAAHRHREPESRLADYLEAARALLADPPPVPTTGVRRARRRGRIRAAALVPAPGRGGGRAGERGAGERGARDVVGSWPGHREADDVTGTRRGSPAGSPRSRVGCPQEAGEVRPRHPEGTESLAAGGPSSRGSAARRPHPRR